MVKIKIKPYDPKTQKPIPQPDTKASPSFFGTGGQAPAQPQKKKEDSIIKKMVRIIIDDINFKFRGIKSKERMEWEEKQKIYESFYRMARGEK